MDLITLSVAFMVGLFLGWFVLDRPEWAENFWAWLTSWFGGSSDTPEE